MGRGGMCGRGEEDVDVVLHYFSTKKTLIIISIFQ